MKFKYLEEHPYKTTLGIILGIIALILAIIFWLFPIFPEYKGELSVPVFNLLEKISSEKTTLERQEMRAEYVGLRAQDSGYILDIEREGKYKFSFFGLTEKFITATIVKNMDKNENYYASLIIKCRFAEDWTKRLTTVNFSDEIKFRGTITDEKSYYQWLESGIYFPSLVLKNCILEK